MKTMCKWIDINDKYPSDKKSPLINNIVDVVVKQWDARTDSFVYKRIPNVRYKIDYSRKTVIWDKEYINSNQRVVAWMEAPEYIPEKNNTEEKILMETDEIFHYS